MESGSACARRTGWWLWPALAAWVVLVFASATAQAAESWEPTGTLVADRGEHTATLLTDGRVLVAGGEDGGALSSSEIFDPGTGSWTTTGDSLSTPRFGHTGTLLFDGTVLVAGGSNGGTLSSSEIFDPLTGNWTGTGSLGSARSGHSATLLKDGRVLVAGGANGGALSSSEIYDPATGDWTATGSLGTARSDHTATLLGDGRVLVAGGVNGTARSSSERYDPATGGWTATGSLGTARTDHTATRLTDGTVLVAGGSNLGGALSSSERFNPSSGSWSATGSLGTGRFDHSASLLADGRVLATGGRATGVLASSETFDPASGTWSPTAENPSTGRAGHSATLLAGGRVLAAGGLDNGFNGLDGAEIFERATPTATVADGLGLARRLHQTTTLADGRILLGGGNTPSVEDAEIYNQTSGIWVDTGDMVVERRFHTSTLLPDGRVLATGGVDAMGDAADSAELFDPDSGSWSATDSMSDPRLDHADVLLADGRVLIAAGGGPGLNPVDLDSAEIYSPTTGMFSNTGSLGLARIDPLCVLLRDDRVLVMGGLNDGNATASSEIWDPSTGLWTTTGSLGTPRTLSTATLLSDGRVLVVGGADQQDEDPFVILADAEIFDPASGTWTPTDSLAAARFDHAATPLPDGRVLISGGFLDTLATTKSLEIFDPAANGGLGSFSSAGTLTTARGQHTADLLPDGRVLIAGGTNSLSLPELLGLVRVEGGGWRRGSVGSSGGPRVASIALALKSALMPALSSSEILDRGLGFNATWRPGITGATTSLGNGQPMVVTGTGFRGVSEASGGNGGQSSPSDHPVVQVRTLENHQIHWLLPDSESGWTSTTFRSAALTGFPEGHYRVTVFTNGIPSKSVFGLRGSFPSLADLGITKTDGMVEVDPGGSLTYTIVGTNTGPTGVLSAQVVDTFPASLGSCSWTCVGDGGSCTPGPVAGNIMDTVGLPVDGMVTYTASCMVDDEFQGKILNTAEIVAPLGVTDSFAANNAATDETLSVCMLLEVSGPINTTETFVCRVISTVGVLDILLGGDVTFSVSERATFSDGFSIGQGAQFRVLKTIGTAPPAGDR